ncbi:MAG: hypothetical protein ACRCYU_06540 [Nocardioides sp.]
MGGRRSRGLRGLSLGEAARLRGGGDQGGDGALGMTAAQGRLDAPDLDEARAPLEEL